MKNLHNDDTTNTLIESFGLLTAGTGGIHGSVDAAWNPSGETYSLNLYGYSSGVFNVSDFSSNALNSTMHANVAYNGDGIGVAGKAADLTNAPAQQINYDPAGKNSETLLVNFNHPVSDAEISISNLSSTEKNLGDYGSVTAYDANGNEVGSFIFGAANTHSHAVSGGQLVTGAQVSGADSITYTFEALNYDVSGKTVSTENGNFDLNSSMLTGNEDFQYLAFQAVPYGAEFNPQSPLPTNDSSHYFVQGVTATYAALPSAPVISGITSGTDGITNVTTPTFTGTGTSGQTINLYNELNESNSLGQTIVQADGTWSITSGSSNSLADGSYNFVATATDPASSLVSSASSPDTVVIDTAPPVITADSINYLNGGNNEVVLSSSNLDASISNVSNEGVTNAVSYLVSNNLTGGSFDIAGQVVDSFTQAQVNAGDVSFVSANDAGGPASGDLTAIDLADNQTTAALVFPLFTYGDNNVDFNSVEANSYVQGTQYNSLGAVDTISTVTLPDSKVAADASGYAYNVTTTPVPIEGIVLTDYYLSPFTLGGVNDTVNFNAVNFDPSLSHVTTNVTINGEGPTANDTLNINGSGLNYITFTPTDYHGSSAIPSEAITGLSDMSNFDINTTNVANYNINEAQSSNSDLLALSGFGGDAFAFTPEHNGDAISGFDGLSVNTQNINSFEFAGGTLGSNSLTIHSNAASTDVQIEQDDGSDASLFINDSTMGSNESLTASNISQITVNGAALVGYSYTYYGVYVDTLNPNDPNATEHLQNVSAVNGSTQNDTFVYDPNVILNGEGGSNTLILSTDSDNPSQNFDLANVSNFSLINQEGNGGGFSLALSTSNLEQLNPNNGQLSINGNSLDSITFEGAPGIWQEIVSPTSPNITVNNTSDNETVTITGGVNVAIANNSSSSITTDNVSTGTSDSLLADNVHHTVL